MSAEKKQSVKQPKSSTARKVDGASLSDLSQQDLRRGRKKQSDQLGQEAVALTTGEQFIRILA